MDGVVAGLEAIGATETGSVTKGVSEAQPDRREERWTRGLGLRATESGKYSLQVMVLITHAYTRPT